MTFCDVQIQRRAFLLLFSLFKRTKDIIIDFQFHLLLLVLSPSSGTSTYRKTMSEKYTPIAELTIADSRFLGFCFRPTEKKDLDEWKRSLHEQYPSAAHIPIVWKNIPTLWNFGKEE